jgi:hypothetical protein
LREFCRQRFAILGTPSHWQIYLLVSACDALAATAKNLGAKLYMPPMPIENLGRMAISADQCCVCDLRGVTLTEAGITQQCNGL